MDKEVSIIVPMYNVEKYIERCLSSLSHQTIESYEVICIDDCSPDGSAEIASRFSNKYPNKFRLYRNATNIGLGKTRERGISLSEAPYVMFVDSDDYVADNYIETYLAEAKNSNAELVIGGYSRDVDGKITPHYPTNSDWSLISYTIACAKLYKKSFLTDKGIHFSSTRCGEDIFFSSMIFLAEPSYSVLGKYAGYYYYFNRNSITSSAKKDRQLERYIAGIYDELFNDGAFDGAEDRKLHMIEYCYYANMVNALVVYGKGCGKKRMQEKVAFVFNHAATLFQNSLANPLLRSPFIKGESLKRSMGVYLALMLHRHNLDRSFYYLVAKL